MQRLLHDMRRSLASPSRTPRMATVLGRLLGLAFVVCFATGLYSHFLQDPLPWMHFATRPTWLYQVSQGIHITAGIVCFPLILGKLYVVFPELFQSPPVRSFPHFLERASIALFVAASLVQITIGLLNTFQLYALFPFPFRQTHWALSFVVIGSLAIHIGVKLPVIAKHWRKKPERVARQLTFSTGGAPKAPATATRGVTGRVFAWIDQTPGQHPSPADARTSRRGFLATIAVASAALVALTAGQSFRVLDFANAFGPRKMGTGPSGVPINRTAEAADVLTTANAANWTLTVTNGDRSMLFSRDDLLAMQQYTVRLPIACVEGWSQWATWRGPRMRDLADLVGAGPDVYFRATSLEQDSIYAVMEMGPEFVRDELTLVALELNGDVLDIDHGYPARMIAPARPGVLQTKWLSSLEVI
ncbi:molybdopterin-dependent oxidoreductase [Marisediminicola senii]|uniref:molybdopterin-dependent oxidoreductase n=1 Tax=Marisediminicola senii TaxID=2711233 RepID=UPI0013EA6480|nr:molybdopterin-dependent oxidoreductase [Marisediminicola senii]